MQWIENCRLGVLNLFFHDLFVNYAFYLGQVIVTADMVHVQTWGTSLNHAICAVSGL